MKNRTLLVCIGLVLVAVLVAPHGTLAKTYKFTAAAAWEKNHPNNAALLHLMDAVNKKCKTKDGNLEFKWVGGPETFKARDLPDVCKVGSVDLFLSSNLYYGGKVPQSSYTALPYAWSFDNASQMWHAGIGELVDKAWQKKDLKVLSFGSLLSFHFFLTKPFSKVSDFKGKKIRVPGGLFAYIPGHIGAVSTRLASAEVYGAMQRGTIDGGFQPFSSYVKYSYWEVAPYVLSNPFTISGAWYWANLKKFNGLPKSLQNKLLEIARAEEAYVVEFWGKKHAEWKKVMKANKVKFVSFSSEDDKTLQQAIMKLKSKLAEQVPKEESEILFKIYDKFAK